LGAAQETSHPDQSIKLFWLAVQIFNMNLHDLLVVPNIFETKLQDLPAQEIQEVGQIGASDKNSYLRLGNVNPNAQ